MHPLHPEKREVRIYDYVDSRVGVLARMFDRRTLAYRATGYARFEEPQEPAVEFDPLTEGSEDAESEQPESGES